MRIVSVITVNYNQSAVTEALLQSIAEKEKYQPLEIIVVDNGSRDNPIPGWQVRYPQITFIRSETNLGFAGGNNLGLKYAKGEFFFFVNNDTEFTDGLIEQLIDTFDRNPGTGMVSPKIRYYSNPTMLQYAGFTPMDYYTCRNKCIGQFETDKGQYDGLTGETGYIHGAAMMLSKDAIEKAGIMSENYFLYYEEMDWCEKVRKAGYKIRVNLQALIYHKESVSVGSKSALKEYFMNRNRILFIRRNVDGPKKWIFWAYFLTIVAPRNILSYIKEKQFNFIPVLLRAIVWNLTHNNDSAELGFKLN